MKHDRIIVKNARTHDLKNISLEIPKNKLVVFTGVSGSGKSSLVFDTIYTESQRQLIETFSTFARARMPKLSRPDVDEIDNLSTAIVIDHNLDIIKQADWVIDLGPEGGARGGEVIFEGTPDDLMNCETSHTGKYLRMINV